MNVIGYRVEKKFDGLKLDDSYEAAHLDFLARKIIEGFRGLVLFHGDPDCSIQLSTASGQRESLDLREVFAKSANERRCAFLIFSTVVIPAWEPFSDFIHCYSRGISNDKPNQFEPLFRTLVDHFHERDAMPDEQTMQELWAQVDPSATQIELLRLLESFLYEQDEEKAVPAHWKQKLEPYYGPAVTYLQVLQAYGKLTETTELKKN
jgi:hypothetical protein